MLVTITVALAALGVLAAIVVVATGGGGELSAEHPDHPRLALPGRRPAGGTDAVLLRLPMGLWGYHKQITDEALERFAHELTERDTRIAVLEQELAEARRRLNEEPERSTWRPAVPPASPAPDAMDLRDPFEPVDPRPSGEGDPPPPPHHVQEAAPWERPAERPADPPRTRWERPADPPPQTIVDRVVFDPRTGGDAEEGPAPSPEGAEEQRRPGDLHETGESDRRGEDG
ncbi:hypothetical protein [Actinoallomurus soli]|uniref:hypothetical protein n=1 Tax=Actinoallomurus soli TaxID=2952535 RepID=UPI0020923FA1|nr:hypothetical protein [Actinoallomurus soli]MCO5972039.1 hypothetical protein [Actinoallomurus soli]